MKLFNLFSFGKRNAATIEAPTVEDVCASMRSEMALHVRADSINLTERSVEAVATTGNPVPMFDMERWEIVDEILVPSGGQMPLEMPMLDSHQRHSCKNVLGGVSNPRMTNAQWVVKLTFDEGDEGEDAFRKIRKRFLRDVSLGYKIDPDHVTYIQAGMSADVNGVTYTAAENRTLKVCSQWTGQEVSPTPIGADKDAKIRAAVMLSGRTEQKRYDELAAELHDAIVDTGLPRDEVIGDMAAASGMADSEVNEILEGDTAPNAEQLDGFAAALEADLEPLAELI